MRSMMSDLKVKPEDDSSMRKFLVLFHGPKDSETQTLSPPKFGTMHGSPAHSLTDVRTPQRHPPLSTIRRWGMERGR